MPVTEIKEQWHLVIDSIDDKKVLEGFEKLKNHPYNYPLFCKDYRTLILKRPI